jgi:hypothetical protein
MAAPFDEQRRPKVTHLAHISGCGRREAEQRPTFAKRRALAWFVGVPARRVLVSRTGRPYTTLQAVSAIVEGFRETAALFIVPVYEVKT